MKVVAANVVSNSLGTIADIPRLAAWTHERGAILTCDAAQAAPHVRLDVQALGADFIAVSSHKMLGPSGIGFLWGRRELLLEMEPFLLGGHMIRNVGDERTTLGRAALEVRGRHPAGRRGRRARCRDRLPRGGRPRGDRGPRAQARRLRARAARRGPRDHPLRPAGRPPRRDRDVQRRRRAPARHGADPRLRRVAIRAGHHCCQPLMRKLGVAGDEPRELLPLHDRRGDRPPRRGRAEGAKPSVT